MEVVTGKIVEEGVGKEPEVVSEKVSGADEPLDMVLSTDIQRALKDCGEDEVLKHFGELVDVLNPVILGAAGGKLDGLITQLVILASGDSEYRIVEEERMRVAAIVKIIGDTCRLYEERVSQDLTQVKGALRVAEAQVQVLEGEMEGPRAGEQKEAILEEACSTRLRAGPFIGSQSCFGNSGPIVRLRTACS